MSKYVDADALLDKLPDDLPYKGSVRRVLIQAPAADVKPVLKSEWIRYSPFTDTFACKHCEYNIIDEEFKTPYCPICGADMGVPRDNYWE